MNITHVSLVDNMSNSTLLSEYLIWLKLLWVLFIFGFVFQDLERQNESLQESLRKYQLEQRALLDKVILLQQQLTQVNACQNMYMLGL